MTCGAVKGAAVRYPTCGDNHLTGGPAKQITDFKSGRIFRFGWSRDGKQLLTVRGGISSDVILIRNFR